MSMTGLLLVSGQSLGAGAVRSLAATSLTLAKSQLCQVLYVYLTPTGLTGPGSCSQIPGSSTSSSTTNLVTKLSQFTDSFYSMGSKICPHIDIRLLVRSLLPTLKNPPALSLSRPIDCAFVQGQIPKPEVDQLLALFSVTASKVQIIQEQSLQVCNGLGSDYQIPTTQLSICDTMKDVVALGGTFDRLHNGHRMLLSEAVIRCNKELIVGVTDDAMIQNKVLKELIEPINTRIQTVQEFLSDIGPGLIHRVIPISDPFGPTIVEKHIDLIVVSEETVRGAKKINEIRTEKSFPILQIHTINLFQDPSSESEREESKISSSSGRLRVLGKRFRPPLKPPTVPYVIGLTGGIASGKSKICSYLRDHANIPIIDCDKLGHAAYKSGTSCFSEIVNIFGTEILSPNPESAEVSEINRRSLGSKVFGKPEELKKLTDIVWPEIRRLALEQIETFVQSGYRIVILDAAVLFEAGWDDMCHDIWVTFVPKEEAIQRIQARDQLSVEDAEKRIDSQLSNRERIARATFVFCSLWEYEFTQEQVEKALRTVEQEISKQKEAT